MACSKSFTESGNLKRHIRTVHKGHNQEKENTSDLCDEDIILEDQCRINNMENGDNFSNIMKESQ